jgi:hypothetical protein
VEAIVTQRGFKANELQEMLDEYQDLGVLVVDADRTYIELIVGSS